MQKTIIALFFLFTFVTGQTQKPKETSASDIFLQLKKLNVLGSVLYMAAHPDDENTALIAYYANQKLYNTNYLSLTRGDGGQNLIGSELREKLGIIRTQELLQARRTDGGNQYFATANDFGFSKNPEEVFSKWNKDTLLANAVWIIRKLQPDVMMTRFPKDARAGHGQHSASSILAEAAFKAAADPKAFPEQLQYVKPWQVKRLVWNTGSWSFANRSDFQVYTARLVHFNIGQFNPYIGMSVGEIAAQSRSMHKSQAFGTAGNRDADEEYFEPTLGITAKNDLFEDINTTWTRIPQGATVQQYVDQAIAHYDMGAPDRILPYLTKACQAINRLADSYWKREKIEETKRIIQNILGLYMASNTAQSTVSPGDKLSVTTEITNRSHQTIQLDKITFSINGQEQTINKQLNEKDFSTIVRSDIQIPVDAPYSVHYWLRLPYNDDMYHVQNIQDLGQPENVPAITAKLYMHIVGDTFSYEIPVRYKQVDAVKGELVNPLYITPKAFVNMDNVTYMFPNNQAKTITIKVLSNNDAVKGIVQLDLPNGWTATPASQDVQLAANDETDLIFGIQPSTETPNGIISAHITVDGTTTNLSADRIQYDHIPTQLYMPKAIAKAENFAIKTKGKNIGYLMGAGDDVPAGLRQISYNVTLLQDKDMAVEKLRQYDAIMVGIRGYNTLPKIAHYQDILLQYCKNGGNVMVQYNVFRGLVSDKIGPYPITLSNDRVTDENAPVTFVNPNHPALNIPNKITQKDFDGWVQERGLYFPSAWDNHYQTIIASHDPNEKNLDGGILVTQYGKGYFVYSVYDWFRELPAGVPGAYRLLANLLSLGKD
ncbi:MAG: PIG-L family deacetylase [Chitinophagaceae bacterium]